MYSIWNYCTIYVQYDENYCTIYVQYDENYCTAQAHDEIGCNTCDENYCFTYTTNDENCCNVLDMLTYSTYDEKYSGLGIRSFFVQK